MPEDNSRRGSSTPTADTSTRVLGWTISWWTRPCFARMLCGGRSRPTAPKTHSTRLRPPCNSPRRMADSLPPSWDGGGLIDASQPVYDTQFLPPHTGMCYTPPKFSDHIAVTLCLDNTPHTPAGHHIDFGQRVAVDMKDTKTTRSQPHRGWKGIQSFFQPAPKPTPAANNQSSSAAPAPAPAAANNGNKNNGSSSGAIDLTAGDDANGTGAPVRQPTQQQQQQQRRLPHRLRVMQTQ
mmetsp:Transcript_23600/g.67793  ORF Transcript_23600/g.67793 Transcript_23600/m.67793 type:complete len:237 (+) Transcript_23600:612-1322(+)